MASASEMLCGEKKTLAAFPFTCWYRSRANCRLPAASASRSSDVTIGEVTRDFSERISSPTRGCVVPPPPS